MHNLPRPLQRVASVLLFGVISSCFAIEAAAKPKAQEICVYKEKDGTVRQTRTKSDVPRSYKSSAKCFAVAEETVLAKPDEIELDGNKRVEELSTNLGPLWLSWQRSSEREFGRTPRRAVIDAANTISKALKNGAFPTRIQTLNIPWKILFLDSNLPAEKIPASLIQNCHPGWMTPPANIYIVAQRVASGCGPAHSSASIADSTLTEVLLHEMGHVVEFYLLDRQFIGDRMRAEGFATWFETYAADFSSILNKRTVFNLHLSSAKRSFRDNPKNFTFQGSAEDYARASLIFHAIVEERGLAGLVEVYKVMAKEQLLLFAAVEKALGWNREQLENEVLKIAGLK